jgi:hypothetical protein
MGISEKLISSFGTAPAHRSDSTKAREFVRETYKKAGGRPTPELERVYGEYLKYKREKQPRPPRKD